ncbi:MAG: hypothetical protein QW303_00215 [Nitrososphaerota archaeon]
MRRRKKCGPGEILKIGYKRHAYYRRPYVRKDGTHVTGAWIPESEVKPTCIRDVGNVGKGPKTLPRPDSIIHLSDYGYAIRKPTAERHAALRRASRDTNPLLVLKRLNLIRNYQPIPEIKQIFSRDVDYMKKVYAKYKKIHGSIPRHRITSFKKHQHGGGSEITTQEPLTDVDFEQSDNSTSVEKIDSQISEKSRSKSVSIKTSTKKVEVCDTNGKCETRIIVFDLYQIDGRNVIFRTLDENDTHHVLILDRIYIDPNQSRETVLEKLKNNKGLLIGIFVDEILEGYFQYKPLDKKNVKIIWFCANRGYGTILYKFLEKFLKKNEYKYITIDLDKA